MIKYEAVIFDLDGTLLNTAEDLANAVNYALKKNGLPTHSIDKIVPMVGNGVRNLILRASNNAPEALIEKLLVDFKIYYGEHNTDKTVEYDGITELLTRLKENGIKTAIVSNKYDKAVKKLSEKYFKGLINLAVGEDGSSKKPDPYMVNNTIELLGVEKSKCVYVGDSEVDILTAKNAEIDGIFVSWGFKCKEFLVNNGATNIVDSVFELYYKLGFEV